MRLASETSQVSRVAFRERTSWLPLSSVVGQRQQFTLARLLVAAGILGVFVRFLIVSRALGSNDMTTWGGFANEIRDAGLGHIYDENSYFNHPPLMGLMAAGLLRLAQVTGMRFETLFKTPMILADVMSGYLIYRSWANRSRLQAAFAFAAFCWNPVSLMITSYHGNTDSLGAGLSLLAAVLVDCELPFLGGVALAASINVKLIPVLLCPVLLSCVRSRRHAMRFVFGLSLGVLPFVPIAIWHWAGFHAHVLAYRSYPGEWGITGLLKTVGTTPHFAEMAQVASDFWVKNGALFALSAPIVLAALNFVKHRWSARELVACTYAAFLVLTPGWGIQYLVYVVPALFAANTGRAIVYTAVAGAYAFVVYYGLWTGTSPFFSDFLGGQPMGGQCVGYLAWLVAARTVGDLLRAKRPPPFLTDGAKPSSLALAA